MPWFFFHLRGGPNSLDPDDLGLELPDIEAAYLQAFQAAKDMAQDWLRSGQNPRQYAFEVMNAAGELLLELPFSEALDHQAGRRPAMLSRSVRTAKERGERMTRLTTEVAQQVTTAQENLRRSQELLRAIGKGSTASGCPF